jgi:hypothetical protein
MPLAEVSFIEPKSSLPNPLLKSRAKSCREIPPYARYYTSILVKSIEF